MAQAKTKTTRRTAKREPKTATPARGSESSPQSKLTDRQRIFIENYLQSWNATDAARKAGYADPELSGWHNRQNKVIEAEIKRRIGEVAMGADECLLRIGKIARGSLRPFVREVEDDVWPDLTSEDADKNFDLLKKIKPKRRVGGPEEDRWTETEIELEIHDPMRALELIGRHHKLFTDKVEHGGTIETKDATDEERLSRQAGRIAQILDAARARRDRSDSE